ncbi:MAG: RagB/SusD family nutrient uptake outer membrane protein [Tannerella sp.]|jgi:hypothetical protein|nr:RagB/SusD family nutrient uptake outer membrane protein [Tannerella sp.]
MKTINKIVIASLIMFSVSCDENKFLEEKPLSIYAAENSLVTNADYNAAVVHLYNRVRYMLYEQQVDGRNAFWYATDLAFAAHDENKLNKYAAFMTPTYDQPVQIYNNLYVIVNQANLILTRLENANLPDADKNAFRGEALFFRAFGYRILANLFGGVPLILTEVDKPRRDFVRATREETYTQAKNDLTEAISLLANIDNVKDGKVSKQLAQHLLSEIYISLGDYDNAVSAATAVIDYPGTGLMTSRFGSKINETPGNVCSDLHRTGNQNRSSGNTETLWASQYDYLNAASTVSDSWMNCPNPFYSQITITVDGVTTTAFKGNTAEKGGRSTGWMQSTDYFYYEIWEPGDLRNAPHIIVRDVQIDNEESPAFGKWFVADGYSVQADPYRQWYPFIGKNTSDVPEDLYQRDADGNPLLTALGEHLIINAANSLFRDKYIFRLAETYLLRAEAYLGKNDKTAAAADINVVRARAQAPLANASEVDIDYILDERLRELYYEELRACTLCRLGKLAERTRKYNSSYTAKGGRVIETSGTSIQDYHNLWPIPFAEIERNIFAVLEQNPGYTN